MLKGQDTKAKGTRSKQLKGQDQRDKIKKCKGTKKLKEQD